MDIYERKREHIYISSRSRETIASACKDRVGNEVALNRADVEFEQNFLADDCNTLAKDMIPISYP